LLRCFPVVLLVLGLFALSPTARAVDPPPDGGYPNENTAEGDFALFRLTSGSNNTASGFQALYQNNTGKGNTASGSEALFSNTTGIYNTADGFLALLSNTIGTDNTASGVQSASTQYNRQFQRGLRKCCAVREHNRQRQHGQWC